MRARAALTLVLAALALAVSVPGRAAGTGDKAAVAALPAEAQQWLDFVAPIILPEEKKAFLELTQPYEREAFEQEFWKRRERDTLRFPLGPGYKQRYAELREVAETRYDGWPHDAAAMVIRHGEPV